MNEHVRPSWTLVTADHPAQVRGMEPQPSNDQLHELDRALLDEHGPSYIETICTFAEGMKAEGRHRDAVEALQQCDRMRAILMDDTELVAAYEATSGETGEQIANALETEMHRRGLDT